MLINNTNDIVEFLQVIKLRRHSKNSNLHVKQKRQFVGIDNIIYRRENIHSSTSITNSMTFVTKKKKKKERKENSFRRCSAKLRILQERAEESRSFVTVLARIHSYDTTR